MNAHPDTAARAATDMHRQLVVAAEKARLIKPAQLSYLAPPQRRWLARLVSTVTGGHRRTRPTAADQTTPATTSMADQHAWSQG
jgi:hypothetical protein